MYSSWYFIIIVNVIISCNTQYQLYLISFPEITVSLSMGSNITEGTMETLYVILDIPSGGTEVDIAVELVEMFRTAGGDVIIIIHIECRIHTHNQLSTIIQLY